MSLASNYAAVLTGGSDAKSVVSYMKQKGHLSLLPDVLRILERGGTAQDTVTVAREEDVKSIHAKFPGAKVVVDPKVVGGYLARLGSQLIDATHRKALVTIYKNAISN